MGRRPGYGSSNGNESAQRGSANGDGEGYGPSKADSEDRWSKKPVCDT